MTRAPGGELLARRLREPVVRFSTQSIDCAPTRDYVSKTFRPLDHQTMNVASSHAPAPLLVRRHEAAKMLAVHVRTLDGWLASVKLPSVKKGARCLRIRVSDLLKFIGDT